MTIHELTEFPGTDAAPSKRVVILGAGYAGLRCAQTLDKYLGEPDATEIVLIDRYSYHQIITELPVAAGGRLGSGDVAVPLADLLKKSKVRFEQAEIQTIDLQGKRVITTRGDVAFGVLVIAVGSVTAFYGVPGLVEHALTLKSVEDAEVINARVRQSMEAAVHESDPAARAAMLSFLIGGAGLTGVELAGELAEFLPTLAGELDLPPTAARVTLIEAAPSVLPSMPPRLQAKGAGILTELGIRLVLGSKVIEADSEGVRLASGDRLVGRTLVWSGGIMAPPILAQSGIPTVRNGQIPVDRFLRVSGFPDVYVVGDSARIQDESGHGIVEPTAQVAVKQAEAAAYNIVAGWERWKPRPYSPSDKGQAISLGSSSGVGSIFHVSLAGRKVIALKRLIEEGYRYSVTGRVRLTRKQDPVESAK
ncbi:MAG: FAD-dependent pyridine nucleotide-disulfide oxidoreductase [Chloroflexi bacterium]|nr:FAD-dependent pyridine nucleotide-disulfide oxidoreductase [Chloroflexota bacterium]